MAKEPLQPQDKYVVRFPDGMRERLKEAAQKANRSLNAEILYRLDNWDQAIEQIDLTHEGWEQTRQENEKLRADLEEALAEKHRMRQLGWDRANTGPSDSEIDIRRALQLALDSLEASVEDQRRTLMHDRHMLSQMQLMRGLLDRVAATDGQLPDGLLMLIRMLTQLSGDVSNPPVTMMKLLENAYNAVEELEKLEGRNERT